LKGILFRHIYDLGGLNEGLFCCIYSVSAISGVGFICYLVAGLFSYKTFCFGYLLALAFRLYNLLRSRLFCYEMYGRVFDSFFSLGSAFATFVLLCHLTKLTTAMPRPEVVISNITHAYFNAANHQYSFPSAHSGLAALLFINFHQRFGIASKMLFAALVVLVGVSRIVLGVHYPSDVIWGFALGAFAWTLSGFLCRRFYPIVRQLKVRMYFILSNACGYKKS
jgi:membrane-associated phospholipid phosphatase